MDSLREDKPSAGTIMPLLDAPPRRCGPVLHYCTLKISHINFVIKFASKIRNFFEFWKALQHVLLPTIISSYVDKISYSFRRVLRFIFNWINFDQSCVRNPKKLITLTFFRSKTLKVRKSVSQHQIDWTKKRTLLIFCLLLVSLKIVLIGKIIFIL